MTSYINAIATEAGLSRRSVEGALSCSGRRTSNSALLRISSAITKLYYPVTPEDLRVGVGVSSNPFLASIYQRRRIRRDASQVLSFKDGLDHLLSSCK